MKKIFLIFLSVLVFTNSAFAADIDVWQDSSLKFSEIKKIFIMPFETKLEAGNSLMPEKQQNAQIYSWVIDGIGSSMGKGTLTIKTLDALKEDMKFIYGEKIPEGEEFFKAASEMGYGIFIRAALTQNFVSQHVPEQTRTYTEYKEIQKRDRNGKIIETLRIPEEKTEITPAHDVTYLSTNFEPKIFMTSDPEGDHYAAAKGSVYREYQGGPVMKVVENLVKASMKSLFAHEEKENSKSKNKRKK